METRILNLDHLQWMHNYALKLENTFISIPSQASRIYTLNLINSRYFQSGKSDINIYNDQFRMG